MKWNYLLVIVMVWKSAPMAFAQADNDKKGFASFGIKVIDVWRSMTYDLGTTIMSEPYFINYTMRSEARYHRPGAAVFYGYRSDNGYWGIETELSYTQQRSELRFNNYEKDYNYHMEFKSHYLNLGGMLKVYPLSYKFEEVRDDEKNAWEGFYGGGGLMGGYNLNSDNIVFTSGGTGRQDAFGSDLEQQQQLNRVLKPNINIGFILGAGYEFTTLGAKIDFKWFFGFADVEKTQANSYNFIENKNVNKAFMVALGYNFDSWGRKKQ